MAPQASCCCNAMIYKVECLEGIRASFTRGKVDGGGVAKMRVRVRDEDNFRNVG